MAVAVSVSIAQPDRSFGRMGFLGLAPVRIGMTPSEAASALGDELTPYTGTAATESCYMVHPSRKRALLMMVENGTVVRIETESDEFATESGIRVGDAESDVREVYKDRVIEERHPYKRDGHYFVINSADGKHAVVLESDGEFVTQIRAGSLPAVRYIEHCL